MLCPKDILQLRSVPRRRDNSKRLAKRITIKDVARESGVDVSTVSCCFNHKGYVNPETQVRILAEAERLNYLPNHLARGLVTGNSRTLGLIISDIRNPFFAEMARGVGGLCQPRRIGPDPLQ